MKWKITLCDVMNCIFKNSFILKVTFFFSAACLFTFQSKLYLSPENVSKGETEETLEHMKKTKNTLKSFNHMILQS